MLDNKPMQDQQYPPYHMPGRWYKVEFRYDEDDELFYVTKSDLPDATFFILGDNTPVLFCGHRFFPVDFKVYAEYNDIDWYNQTKDGTPAFWKLNTSVTGFDSPEFAITLGSRLTYIFTSGTFYIFGYFMP